MAKATLNNKCIFFSKMA